MKYDVANIIDGGGGIALAIAFEYAHERALTRLAARTDDGKPDNIHASAIAPGRADIAFRAQIREDRSRMLSAEDQVGLSAF